jgi:flavin reductase (DIM6/NTAB) family NADH-FMN oxidoreductase RutF
MTLFTENTEESIIYKLLTGVIIPRPIAWIATIDNNGVNNLAPFSYFNMVSSDPPCVMFSARKDNNQNKDTLNNVLENGEFVVNLVTFNVVEQMNATSASVAPEIDEFELTNLTPIDSELIKPKRVKECLVHLECEKIHHYFIDNESNGGACVIIGKVKVIHINEDIVNEKHHINLETYKPIARLAGSNYSKIGEVFQIKRN